MSQSNFSSTYTDNVDITIPGNAGNIVVTVAGARGGGGGSDGGIPGGPFGAGRIGSFNITGFVQRLFQLRIGKIGSNGPSSCASCGGAAGGVGASGGGSGGFTGPQGSSGGGGGGGGSSGIYDASNNLWIVVAGGGGGGGGASYPSGSFAGGAGGVATDWSGTSNVSPLTGGDGLSQGFDGGAGGGGGGGSPNGGGGREGADDRAGGYASGGGGGGGSQFNTSYASFIASSNQIRTDNGYISVAYTTFTPEINDFSYTPIPQNSGTDGVPRQNVFLSWTVVDAQTITIDQGVGNVTNAVQPLEINTNLLSTAGSNSPATKTYTMTATTGNVSTTRTLTVNVRNDNAPDNNSVFVSSTTTSGASLGSLDPNTVYTVSVGPVTGIDMKTLVTCSTSGLQMSPNGGANWYTSNVIDPNATFLLRFTSLPYNTDPNGIPNDKTFFYSVGTITNINFVATTRSPDVTPTFDFPNVNNVYPFPDIDLISNTPEQYIVSPRSTDPNLIVDGVDIDIEIKTNNPDTEIRIKKPGQIFGNWINTRQI